MNSTTDKLLESLGKIGEPLSDRQKVLMQKKLIAARDMINDVWTILYKHGKDDTLIWQAKENLDKEIFSLSDSNYPYNKNV